MDEGARRPRQAATADTLAGAPADLPAGFAVGEYRVQSLLGRGGMGTVYAAVQPVIEKKVAIKVLGTQFSSTPDLVRRFVDEARAVNRIGHPNIIDIFSFGQLADGRYYFVMEYLEGATLGDLLRMRQLAAPELAPLLAQVCAALDAAHAKKIVHRDLKLDNVWIAIAPGGQMSARLLDFGIAKLLEIGEGAVTDASAVMGTPHYMSPEQCQGSNVDHRTDIYAMGVMLYRIFTGRLPIDGNTFAEILCKQLTEVPAAPSTLKPLPATLDRLILSCLDKAPERRPQSAGALADALTPILAGMSMLPAPGPTAARPAPARRRPVTWLLVAGALCGAGALAVLRRRDPGPAPLPAAAPAIAVPAPAPTATPPSRPVEVRDEQDRPPSHGHPRPPHRPSRTPAAPSQAASTGLATDNPFK
jgi:serine/threonine protein kinase